MSTDVEIPEGYEAGVEGYTLFIKNKNGELRRNFPPQKMKMKVENNKIIIDLKFKDAKTRALSGTFRAHIINMFAGLREQWEYKLKVCAVHFPMNIQAKERELVINNFLGEKKPKIIKMPASVEFSIDGEVITIRSADIEAAGMAAARIEQATRLTGKDRRIFQDGVFIIEKAGKVIK